MKYILNHICDCCCRGFKTDSALVRHRAQKQECRTAWYRAQKKRRDEKLEQDVVVEPRIAIQDIESETPNFFDLENGGPGFDFDDGVHAEGVDIEENFEAYCDESEEPAVLSVTKTRFECIRDNRREGQDEDMPMLPFANRKEWELFRFIHRTSLSRKEVDDLLHIEHVSSNICVMNNKDEILT